jgi:hypothetical protein
MSIEAALAENTAALKQLHALLANLQIRPPIPDSPSPTAAAPEVAAPAPKPKAEAPAATTASSSPTAEVAPAAAPEPKAPQAEAKPLTYEADVKPLIIALGRKDRAKAVALLAEFGAKVGTDVKVVDFPALVARAKELLS